jgi:hypothetical protein
VKSLHHFLAWYSRRASAKTVIIALKSHNPQVTTFQISLPATSEAKPACQEEVSLLHCLSQEPS